MSECMCRRIAGWRKSRRANYLLIGMVLATLGMILLPGCTRPLTYAHDVRPILEVNCLQCHQPGGIGYERSGLDMRTYDSLMKGTKYGRVIIPGDGFDSVLVELIQHRAASSINMPYHRLSLPKLEIEKVKTWIDEGAKP